MKILLSSIVTILLSAYHLSYAQKFGYIDSESILNKIPEYKKAQQEIDKLSVKWQQEIDAVKDELVKLQESYEAEEILLTEDMKKERQDSITAKQKALREKQKNIFGYEGLLFLKRQELMKPIQDKVYEAVQKVAKAKKLQIIFDKSSDLSMIYTNPIHDYTEFVLDELGLGDKNDTIH